MTLDDLSDDVQESYKNLGDELDVSLDRETRHELAMLTALYDPDDVDELVRRAVHTLFQSALDRGQLDFHLRQGYDVTYDEYLSGMTYEEMTGQTQAPPRDDVRRYQM
ncbi:hypothetical protein ACFQJC_00260 [Haloferax namakaokahaiae]|uniref:Uncharacterized protein n=1 Tax=Haloferax namakaokahaiae TaxID=1748331 RepID=A0ABD5Z9R2_9EURY